MTRIALVLALAILGAFPRASFANEGQALAGAGATSCGVYLKDRSERNDALNAIYSTWLQAFLSGMNIRGRMGGDEFALIPDADTLLAYADKHCRDEPLDSLWQAAFSLFSELAKP